MFDALTLTELVTLGNKLVNSCNAQMEVLAKHNMGSLEMILETRGILKDLSGAWLAETMA